MADVGAAHLHHAGHRGTRVALAGERVQEDYARLIKESKVFEGKDISDDAARTIKLLKFGLDAPAPDDPAKRAELSEIETRMVSVYGAGKYCPTGPDSCKNFEQLAERLANSPRPDRSARIWAGWHAIAKPIRKDYQRFVELANEGASTSDSRTRRALARPATT